MFRDYINSLKLEVTEEMYKRHDKEYAGDKSGYSSRANLDSEYLEDNIIENIDEAVRITGHGRFLADVKYRNMKIDFKEIASYWYSHIHFLFFKSNRPRYDSKEYKNLPDVIPVGFELQFEYLGCYDVMQVLGELEAPKLNRVRIQTLQEKYGTV